jgi:hypothetical protein
VLLDWRLTDSLPPSLLSETFSLPPFLRPRTYSSERNGIGSVDWPPTGSTLFPEDGNAEQDDVQVSTCHTRLWVSDLPKVDEKIGDSVVRARTLLSPVQEIASDRSVIASSTTPSHDDPETQPVSVPASAPFLPPPACDRPVDPSFAAGQSTTSLNIGRPFLFPPRLDIPHIPPPVLPKFTLPPRFSITELRPTAIKELFERRNAPSLPPYDDGDVLMGSIPPDSLPQRQLGDHYGSNLLTGIERDFHATGN